jgi:hypothetical protein
VSVAGTYSLVQIDDVDLKPGEARRIDTIVAPNVFEGVVTSQGEGVAAKIIVDDGGQRMYFNSDVNGLFHVALQDKGVYRVVVARLTAQGNFIPAGDVEFTDPTRRIEIAIPPGGSITARVHSGEQAIPNAVVWATRTDGAGMADELTKRGQTTRRDGDAIFNDLVAGTWTFSTRDGETHRGAQKTVTVEEGKNDAIDLELARAAAIRGTIHDRTGAPVPGARVDCLFMGPVGTPDRARAISDSAGTFALDLIPPLPSAEFCSVAEPFGTVDAFKSVPGEESNLTVPATTASLQILDWNADRNPNSYWLVAPDGRAISLYTVARITGGFRAPLTISALPAGRWRVVRVVTAAQWASLATGMGVSIPSVADLTLSPGNVQTVRLH